MQFPKPRYAGGAHREMITTFLGVDKTDTCMESYSTGKSFFSEMVNGGGESYPFAASRMPRKQERVFSQPAGGIHGKDALAVVSGNAFFYDGEQKFDGMLPGEKQILSFGAYILIFPDQKYYNTVTGEHGDMDDGETVSAAEWRQMTLVRASGTTITTGTDLDKTFTQQGGRNYIRGTYSVVSASTGASLDNYTHLALSFSDFAYAGAGVPESFTITNYEKVVVKGLTADIPPCIFSASDGELYLCTACLMHYNSESRSYLVTEPVWEAVGITSIVVPADTVPADKICQVWYDDRHLHITTAEYGIEIDQIERLGDAVIGFNGTFSLAWKIKTIPVFDFVTVCDNRVFGCYKGYEYNTYESVNMLFASALGDFKAWEQFDGVSTDSWFAHCGEDGKFTGACTYGGRPMFFRERYAYILYGDYPPYSYTLIDLRGVADGASKSLCVVDGCLYWKSRYDIMCYSGSSITAISECLGNLGSVKYAVGGAYRGKYYIALDNAIYVYDTQRGTWYAEDAQDIINFAECGGKLYYLLRSGELCVIGDSTAEEPNMPWSLTSPPIGYTLPNRKYVSRILIRILYTGEMPVFELSLDGKDWEICALNAYTTAEGMRTGTLSAPIRPRRCESFRYRVSGAGTYKLTGITKYIEESGS